MAESQMQKHLREYAEDGIQQKIRLHNLVIDYEDQEFKTRERIIDQTNLIGEMTQNNIPQSKIQLVRDRREMDEKALINIQRYLEESELESEALSLRLNAHMEELTAIEVNTGGFVTHAIGVNKGAQLDKESMTVSFENNAHAEVAIGTRMNSWKDSSQLTIKEGQSGDILFSYYFDTKKSHLLNCRFRILQFVEKAEGVNEVMFSIEVEEVRNGGIKKRETRVETFEFPPLREGEVKHDIDFTRVRYSPDRKWIFTVVNNRDNAQQAQIGIISSTANRNPLGMDIYHIGEEFSSELKANNLSILEPSFVPPVLTQTIVSNRFDQAGYPERFTSSTGSYDSDHRNMRLSEFKQEFLEPIPESASFTMAMDIAPYETEPFSGNKIFDLVIPNLGRISLLTHGLEYMIEDGTSADAVRVFFPVPADPSLFWDNGMLPNARMTINGDGKGNLTVSYNGQTIPAVYDASKPIERMEFRGAVSARIKNN